MAELYLVTGLSGVGKSSVIEYALRKIRGVKKVNFGDAILREATRRKLVHSRDQLRLLQPEVQRMLQIKTAERVARMKGKVIVDTHLTVPTPAGYVPGIPSDILAKLKPKRIVVIEADPNEVLKRRTLDEKRFRVNETLKEIEQHMDFDRAAAIAMAIQVACPVKVITNDVVERAGEELAEILASALP